MSDNGKIKTSEELAAERLKRYQDNPDSFTENVEIVVAVKRAPDGLMYKISGTAKELELCGINLLRKIMHALDNLEASANMHKVVPAKHGIIDFMRRRK